MPRWENLVAVAAIVLAGLALLPLGAGTRLVCSGIAIVASCTLLTLRLRAHAAHRSRRRTDEVSATIARIRAARERRGRR
jgi:hypothetical protein